MPISKAIDVVATVGSPNWLNIARAVSRIRSRVRRGGFGGIAFPTLRASGSFPAQRLFEFAERLAQRLHAIPQSACLTRLRRHRRPAFENGPVEFDAMAGEHGLKLAGSAPEFRQRVTIGVLGETAPGGVAEH